MRNFIVNVVPKTEGERVPAALAGQIMIDVQQILSDIGEYIIRRELGIQKSLRPEILSRFILYMDENGISIGTSTESLAVGSITEETIDLMEATMDAMGSGTGGYWMEDNFADPYFRNHIIYDVAALSEHINEYPDLSFMYGSPDNLKTFGKVDIARLDAFMKDRGMSINGAALGIITVSHSKSKGQILGFESGTDKVRLQFREKAVENVARTLIGKGAVYIVGRLIYSSDGDLLEIRDVSNVTQAHTMRFRKLISSDGDVSVKEPVVAEISYDGEWHLKNETLGISVSKPTWDEAVQTFNDYFVFLWTEYSYDDMELVGEDAEIREALKAYM